MNKELIEQEIKNLGNTPDEIYSLLLKNGISGRKRDPCSCPIANYLDEKLDGSVSVFNDEVLVRIDKQVFCLPITQACKEFIEEFDKIDGAYNELHDRTGCYCDECLENDVWEDELDREVTADGDVG